MSLLARLEAAQSAGLPVTDAPNAVIVTPDISTLLPDWPGLRAVTANVIVSEHLTARGIVCSADIPKDADAVLICIPRSKRRARALVAEAIEAGAGLVVIDGAKTDGIEGLYRDCRKRLGDLPCISKAHGRLFWIAPDRLDQPTTAFADWADPGPIAGPDGMVTALGVFSEGRVDAASALLAAHLPETLSGRIGDLGAGWGYLSRRCLTLGGVSSVDLVEADLRALDAARLNLPDPRARFHWADATRWAPAEPLDAIVMNPPFHEGRTGRPDLGRAFIAAAARMLKRRGSLWMVANRHLPYEDTLASHFAHVDELAGTGAFKLFHASAPRR